jgi:hypothetical protein
METLSRNRFLLTCSLLLAFGLVTACGKGGEEKSKVDKAREWELQNFSEGQSPKPKPKPLPKDLRIVVPDSVKAKYKSVTMGVGNLKTKEISKFTVKLGQTAKVPGTDYTIKVDAYLPNWKIREDAVISDGDRPLEPAVRATITEKGKPVFDGFIFKKAKTPSFMTDQYAIGLLGAP